MPRHRHPEAQTREPIDWQNGIKVFALPGLFATAITAVVTLFGNITDICNRDAIRSVCTSIGFQVEPVEIIIIALNSPEPVSRTAAYVKLTELLTKQPEVSSVAKPLFVTQFNHQYAIGSNNHAAEDSNIRAALNLIEILSKTINRNDEIELKNVDLQNVDLSKLNFERVKLTNVLLQDSNMQDFSLKGATILESRMDRAVALRLNLQDTKIENTCFESATLVSANLQNSRLTDVDFNNANLNQANLSTSILNRVRFAGASLTEAVFSGSKPNAISFLPRHQLQEQLLIQFPDTPSENFSFNPRKYSKCRLQ